ncbi:hypothetical protein Aperf_G00000106669 [Anoplocephala perfoliata]
MVCLNLTDSFLLSLLLTCVLSIFAGVTAQDQLPLNSNINNSPGNNIQPQINPQSCSECKGRSICINEDGVPKCLCPPDYYGEFCDLPVHKFPEVCAKSQCENGGICEQGLDSTFCVCPPNYIGITCSRVAVFVDVEMNLYKDDEPISWDLGNRTTAGITDTACNKLILSNLRGPDAVLATTISECSIRNYEKTQIGATEGIRVHALLKYDPGYNEAKLNASNVRRQLELAPDYGNSMGINFRMDKTINITNFDVCKYDLHDCSPSATCVSDGISYSCKCRRFYADGGEPGKALPGRECYYSFKSGFFLGCFVIVPILVVILVTLFYFRRYQARKAWISPSADEVDSIQLVSSQHPKYSA